MWMMKRRAAKIRESMKDPNILYDYIWTKEELDPYREMYDEDKWQGELMPPEVNRGDRHVWVIDGNYPDPDKIVVHILNSTLT